MTYRRPFEQLSDMPPPEIAAALNTLDGPDSFTVCQRDLDVWIQHGTRVPISELITSLELIAAGLRDGRIRTAPDPGPDHGE